MLKDTPSPPPQPGSIFNQAQRSHAQTGPSAQHRCTSPVINLSFGTVCVVLCAPEDAVDVDYKQADKDLLPNSHVGCLSVKKE